MPLDDLTRRQLGLRTLAAAGLAARPGWAPAQATVAPVAASTPASDADLRIALIHSRSGALEPYGKQSALGFQMGLDHATGGSFKVAGRKLVVLERDDQGLPELARDLLLRGFRDEAADLAVGTTSSRATLALLPLAEQFKRVLLVDPTMADAVTGELGNRYVFRTSRSTSQEAIANAVALDERGARIAVLAQDAPASREAVAAFGQGLKRARLVHDVYVPSSQTEFGPAVQRLVDALKGGSTPARKKSVPPPRLRLWVLWPSGPGNPFAAPELQPAALSRLGIELCAPGSTLGGMVRLKPHPGAEGATYYHYAIPKNPANEWLVANHYRRFRSPPDFFTVGGMCAALAVVEALKKTQGQADGDTLVAAMEGLRFDTPKGAMQFRAEDHQALQSFFHYRIVPDAAVPWGVPELVREIRPDEVALPVVRRRG